MFCSRKFISLGWLLVLHISSIHHVVSLRVRMFPEQEPTGKQLHSNYRAVIADPLYYYLRSASVLEDADMDPVQLNEAEPGLAKDKFDFNSGTFIRNALELKWFIPYDERTALQVYDDARDRDLAAGPQVNQQLCGLQLDYMHHMVKKHRTNVMNSTEYSIFRIMDTYDWPRYSVGQANNFYLGDYRGCVDSKLNVMKHELVKVNKSAAERYFSGDLDVPQQQHPFVQWIVDYLGPFVGLPKKSRTEAALMRKNKDKLRALNMRYCLAGIRWPVWPNTSHHKRNVVLRSAVCLPETCDSNSLSVHGDKLKRLTDVQSNDFFSGYYISDLYCLPDEKSELRNPFNYTGTVLFMLFNLIWIMLTALALIIKYKKPETKNGKPVQENGTSAPWRMYLNSWNLRKNVCDFVAPLRNIEATKNTPGSEPSKDLVDLESLEGFKVISSFAVIVSHITVVSFAGSWNVNRGFFLLTRSWIGMVLTVCPAVVDNFFVITGFVTGCIMFKMPRQTLLSSSFWLKFVAYRYIRIVPIYFLAHWFLQDAFRFIGSGPLWDYGTSHSAWSNYCTNESAMTVLLPSANFKSPSIHCDGVGWYLANDVQFAVLTPIFVVAYVVSPLIGHLVAGGSALIIMINHIIYYYNVDQDTRSVFEWNHMTLTTVLDDTSDGYVNPQYRVLAYIVGLSAGYVTNQYSRGEIKQWPRAFVTSGKAFIAFTIYLLCATPYMSSLLPLDNKQVTLVLASVFQGLHHAITSVAAASFVILLCTGHFPRLSKIYKWNFFKCLSNASLTTLLVHIPIIFYHSQTTRTLPELSSYYFASLLVVYGLESYIVSILAHIIYELPLRRFLVKLLVRFLSRNGSGDDKHTLDDETSANHQHHGTDKPKQN